MKTLITLLLFLCSTYTFAQSNLTDIHRLSLKSNEKAKQKSSKKEASKLDKGIIALKYSNASTMSDGPSPTPDDPPPQGPKSPPISCKTGTCIYFKHKFDEKILVLNVSIFNSSNEKIGSVTVNKAELKNQVINLPLKGVKQGEYGTLVISTTTISGKKQTSTTKVKLVI